MASGLELRRTVMMAHQPKSAVNDNQRTPLDVGTNDRNEYPVGTNIDSADQSINKE